MSPFKIPEQQYVISLDSLDMSFLSQYVEKPPDEKRVLWSRPSLKEEIEYYQVELVEQVPEKDDNSYIIESSTTHMCHICNKDIPQMYFSHHMKSKMHQNHKILTDRILQNLSKQMNSEIIITENSKPNNMFYCETCSKLVLSEHKKKHKRSLYHLKSIEIEKLTDNFLDVYCDTKEAKPEEKKKKTRAKNKIKTQQNNVKKEIIDQTESEYNSCSDSESNLPNPFSKKINTICPINDVNKTSNSLNTDKIDLKTVNLLGEEGPEILEVREPTIDIIDTPPIINVVNGNVAQKTFKTSEKFETFSDTDWSDSIGESDNEEPERMKLNGAISYAGALTKGIPKTDQEIAKPNILHPKPQPPIISKECVEFILYLKRMIEKYNFNYDLPMIEDKEIVIVTPKGHKEKISIDAFHGFSRLNHFAYCHLCFKCIDVDTKEHSETEGHVRNILRPINDDFAREWIRNKYVVAHCLLCNETLPGSSNHAASSPNHKKYREPIAKNKDVPVKPDNVCKKTYCEICKIHIDTHNFSVHISSRTHMTNMLTNKPTPSQSTATNTEYCDICKVNVPKHGMGIHEAGKPHKEAKLALSKSKGSKANTSKDKPIQAVVENITTPQDAATNLDYCHTCKVKVPRGGMDVHEAGKSHKNTMIANMVNDLAIRIDSSTAEILKLPGMSKVTPATSLPLKSLAGLTTHEKLIEYYKQMAVCSKSEVKCQVCKSKIANSDPHVIEHVEGARHRSAVAILLRENEINVISSKLYYCQLCNKKIDNFVYHVEENIDHHVKKTLSSGMIDKDILRKYIYQNPEDCSPLAVAYRKVYEVLLDRNKIVRLPNLHYNCKVCSIKMTRISEFDHMFGERHKTCLNSKIAQQNK